MTSKKGNYERKLTKSKSTKKTKIKWKGNPLVWTNVPTHRLAQSNYMN